jgi:hypothetical protein
MIHEVDIPRVAGGKFELSENRSSHIQGIAPPPEQVLRIVGSGEDFVHAIARGCEDLWVMPLGVEREIREADGFVVRMTEARAETPVVLLGDMKDAVTVTLVAGSL